VSRAPDDPFRELEREGPLRAAWLTGQRERWAVQLASMPERDAFAQRFAELLASSRGSLPLRRGGHLFRRTHAGHDRLVLTVESEGRTRVLLDPRALPDGPSLRLLDMFPSPGGELVAARVARAGSSKAALLLVCVSDGQLLGEHVPAELNPVAHAWHTVNQVAWMPDAGGFYYTRRPEQVPDAEHRYHQKLWFHRIGSHWRDDELVFGEQLTREQLPYPQLGHDGHTLLVVVQDLSGSSPCTQLFLRGSSATFVRLLADHPGFADAQLDDDMVFVRTDHGAARGVLLGIPVATPESKPCTLIAEGPEVIGHWRVAGAHVLVETRAPLRSRLWLYARTSAIAELACIGELSVPGIGCVSSLELDGDDQRMVIAFSSPLAARTLLAVDLDTQRCSLLEPGTEALDPERHEVRVVWVERPGGIQIPVLLVHARGLAFDGNNPTVLSGYGGFGVSATAHFRREIVPFVERGGVFALAGIRGGAELGSDWHRAGVREHRQLVFDDFIAVAEHLITTGVTRPAHLGLLGTSNGGLLVTGVAGQRPELFAALVARAPVTDLARFHHSEGGRHWIAEYGDPDDPTQLEFLLRTSPYHGPAPSRAEPAMLIVCGEADDRVPPWHGYKLVAKWQAARGSGRPILLRSEIDVGHRGDGVCSSSVARDADVWAFLWTQLR
jgi:prolyl oligopeptidase